MTERKKPTAISTGQEKKPKLKGAHTKFANKKMKASSKEYLKRQSSDFYVKKARQEGYRSRAAYKLLDIQNKEKFLKPQQTVVDLGAAPGGWLQVISQYQQGQGTLIGIDLLPVQGIANATLIQGDFTEDDVLDDLLERVPNGVDVVVSDMAPSTCGHAATDHLRSMALVEMALDFAIQTLKPGGHFVAKLFQGGSEEDLRALMRQHFKATKTIKPPSSRSDSREVFIMGKEFKG